MFIRLFSIIVFLLCLKVSNAEVRIPSNLRAYDVDLEEITLTWNYAEDNEIYSFKFYRSESRNGNYKLVGDKYHLDSRYYTNRGLKPNTTYYYYVKAYGLGTDYSDPSDTIEVTTDRGYCTSTSDRTWGLFIDSVQINGQKFPSGECCQTYTDRTSTPVVLPDTDSIYLNISVGDCDEYKIMGVYLDWNNDYDFTDEGENIYFPEWDPSIDCSDFRDTIVLNDKLKNAKVRLRIITKNHTYTMSPCGTYDTDGETEDYMLYLGKLPNPPTNLNIRKIGNENVELTWEDNSNTENGFVIERSEDFGVHYSHLGLVLADVKTYIDSTLEFNTSYKYRVYASNRRGNSEVVSEKFYLQKDELAKPYSNHTVKIEQLQADAGENMDILPGESIVLGNAPSAWGGIEPYAYSWNDGNMEISNEKNPVVSPTQNETYYIVVTDSNNCNASDSVRVNVQATSIMNSKSNKKITVFPNPSSSIFQIHSDYKQAVKYRIRSTNGSIISSGVISDQCQINIPFPGIFFMELSLNGKVSMIKLIKL